MHLSLENSAYERGREVYAMSVSIIGARVEIGSRGRDGTMTMGKGKQRLEEGDV